MTVSANLVDYDQVTGGYESGLNTQLRGFRGGARFLEHWVHDPDPVKSIINMVEAAETAGLADVTVVLGARTQAAVDMARLDKLAAELGQVAKEERPEGLALTVRFARAAAAMPGLGAEARDRARRAREARDARLSAEARAVVRRPAADGLHPIYRDAVASILAGSLAHEGTLETAAGGERLQAGRDGWTLAVIVDPATHRVRAARHRQAHGDARALLEALCRIMEDKPLLECADHAVIRLEHRLRDAARPRPVAGVVTPESVEPAFSPLTAAVRELLAEYRRRTGYGETDNRFDPEPSRNWQALTPEQRVQRLQAALDELAAGRGLKAGDVVCTRLDRSTRATVEFHVELPAPQKAAMMMALERALKSTLEGTIHLYQEEMHDKNKIRRL
jgi:hypothetical protein